VLERRARNKALALLAEAAAGRQQRGMAPVDHHAHLNAAAGARWVPRPGSLAMVAIK
jgi:hypothetical protein